MDESRPEKRKGARRDASPAGAGGGGRGQGKPGKGAGRSFNGGDRREAPAGEARRRRPTGVDPKEAQRGGAEGGRRRAVDPKEARKRGGGAAGRRRTVDLREQKATGGFGPFRPAERPERDEPRRTGDRDAPGVRAVAKEAVARGSRSSLRIVHRDGTASDGTTPKHPAKAKARATNRRAGAVETRGAPPRRPLSRPAGKVEDAVVRAARALEREYEREAVRILRPVAELHPDAPEVRSLLGVALYRLGRWPAAKKELEAFVKLTGSVEQHPVLMDCARALGRHSRVEELWRELKAVSPGAEIVTEGRIVAAGSLADRGRLPEAMKLLERGPVSTKRIGEHHLRLWYALADLHERAGDLPGARSLFRRVSSHDPAFFDVAERLAALS